MAKIAAMKGRGLARPLRSTVGVAGSSAIAGSLRAALVITLDGYDDGL